MMVFNDRGHPQPREIDRIVRKLQRICDVDTGLGKPFSFQQFDTPFFMLRWGHSGNFWRLQGRGVYKGLHLRTDGITAHETRFMTPGGKAESLPLNTVDPALVRRVQRLIYVQKVQP